MGRAVESLNISRLVSAPAAKPAAASSDRTSEDGARQASLRKKVAICFGASLVALCAVGIVSYQTITQFIVASRRADHTYQVIASINALEARVSGAAMANRGYVITGDESFLGRYGAAANEIKESMDSLRALTTDNPAQQQRIQLLTPLIAQKLDFFSALARARRTQGFAAAQPMLLTPQGAPLLGEIQDILRAMTGEENSLLGARLRGAESNARRSILLVVGGAFFSGCLICLAGWMVYRDGAARARTEARLLAVDEELRQTAERFRSLVESAKEYAIFLLDRNGLIKTWNPGAERIKGYSAHEIIGRHFSCFYPTEDKRKGKPEMELRIAIEKGQYEEDGWRLRKNGSRFWANVLITPIYDSRGAHIGFSKITRDMTERARLEEQTRNFFTLSLDLLCIAGTDGYFKRLNPAWEKTLGFSEPELYATPYLEFVHPDDRAVTLAAAETIACGMQLGAFENRYRRKDGSYRWLLWKSAVSADSQLIYAAATDITDRKRAENEIAALNETLRRQNLLLESANKELEAFSYSVSHDLRAPLRSLDGFSQALLEDCSDNLDEQGKNYLHRVRSSSQRMGQLIDDLLNLSRVSRLETTRQPVDLSAMARELADELRAAAPQRDVQFVVDENLVAETDPRLMRILLTNLLGNAWKFTGKTPHARVEFGCTGANGGKEYFLRDNGAGFDEAYASKLFGAFQRLHSTNDFPGTGIGLATVQRVVQRLGGRAWAEGKVGHGATFHFTLSEPDRAAA